MTPQDFRDIHTHDPQAGPGALINLPLEADIPAEGNYSVGIHPWDAATPDFALLRAKAAHPRVAAIGETGLDALRGPGLDQQEAVFLEHAALAEELGKPLIIHAVRTHQRLIELRRRLKPSQQWIIHGFRGKPQLALQLLRAGFDISIGEKYNPETLAVIPAGRLYRETDAQPSAGDSRP